MEAPIQSIISHVSFYLYLTISTIKTIKENYYENPRQTLKKKHIIKE